MTLQEYLEHRTGTYELYLPLADNEWQLIASGYAPFWYCSKHKKNFYQFELCSECLKERKCPTRV